MVETRGSSYTVSQLVQYCNVTCKLEKPIELICILE